MCILTYTTSTLCPHTLYTAVPCSERSKSSSFSAPTSFTNTSARMTNEDLHALFKCPKRTLVHGGEVKKEGVCDVCEERGDSSFSSSPEKTKSKIKAKTIEKEGAKGGTIGDGGTQVEEKKEKKQMGIGANSAKQEMRGNPEFNAIHSIHPNSRFSKEGDDPNYRGKNGGYSYRGQQ